MNRIIRLAALASLALTLSACDGVDVRENPTAPTPPPSSNITGQVIKGYVQGASVFADANGNGRPDQGETVVQTDSEGRYTLPAGQTGGIVAIGGVDTVTNVPLDGNVFRAPAGSSVITPFTTLIVELTAGGATATQAEEQVRAALGVTLPAGSTLLNFNSVNSAAVEDKAEVVMNTISAVRSILDGAGVGDAAGAAVRAVTELVRTSNTAVSLASTTVMTEVLQSAFIAAQVNTDVADVALIAQAITNVNTQLLATSGRSDEAVAATRYAQSQLQDLLTQVGQTANNTESSTIDLSELDDEASETIEQIITEPAKVISQGRATTIAAEQRLEDRSFDFSLRPAVVLVNGQAAAVQSMAVRFGITGIELKKAIVASGTTILQTIAPGANNTYQLGYDELDKIQVVPPLHFNGRIPVTVAITYATVGTRPEESLTIEVDAVNDAPVATAGFGTTLGTTLSGVVNPLFATAFDDATDDRLSFNGSQPDTFAGIAIAGNAATTAQGEWQYSKDGGQNWSSLPAVSTTAALLLAGTDRLRFQPASGHSGNTSGALTAYLVDSSAGAVVSGETVDVTTTLRGGASRYSSSSVSLSSGAIVSVRAPVTSVGIGSTINATQLAAGVTFTVALEDSGAVVGDRVELRINGQALQPPVFKALTAEDIAAGLVTFTIPPAAFGTDGPKAVGARLTYISSGVALSSSSLTLTLDTTPPAVPTLALQASSDTGESSSDGITSSRSVVLRVTLPAGAQSGDVVRVFSGSNAIVQATLTGADLQAGNVAVRVDGLADAAHRFTARLADPAANASASSVNVDVAVDTHAPSVVALDLGSSSPSIHGTDAQSFPVTGSGGELGATVEVRVFGGSGQPVTYFATPDKQGRFAVLVDAAAVGPGLVGISARAIDVAGNASAGAGADIVVNASTTANAIAGVSQRDELVGGSVGADIFVAGANPGQDYFIGGSGFDTLQIDGAQQDYSFSYVPTAQRVAHQAILDGESLVLQGGLPLVRVARKGTPGGAAFYVQAEAVQFSDGRVRISPQEIVSIDGLSLTGAAGDDRLFAGNGGVNLAGGAGNDTLVGGTGADRLRNAGCSDSTVGRTLVAGPGEDILEIVGEAPCAGALVTAYGGTGRDRFDVVASAGFDLAIVLGDFRPGEDRIDLSTLRIQGTSGRRALSAGDLDLPALSATLDAQGFAEIDLSRFMTTAGAPLAGTLRIELSPHGFPALQAGDFALTAP